MPTRLLIIFSLCCALAGAGCGKHDQTNQPAGQASAPQKKLGGIDVRTQYQEMEANLNNHKMQLFTSHLAPDFTLSTDKDPSTTFILDGVGAFLDEKGQASTNAKAMQRKEFELRLQRACDAGYHFLTAPGKFDVKEDAITVEVLRVEEQRLTASAAPSSETRYQCLDTWKKVGGDQRLASLHILDVAQK